MSTSSWFTGPEFLWRSEIPSPKEDEAVMIDEDPEVKKHQTFSATSRVPEFEVERFSYFSSLEKLCRAVAWSNQAP